jgi:hypothetical protein
MKEGKIAQRGTFNKRRIALRKELRDSYSFSPHQTVLVIVPGRYYLMADGV